MPFDGIFLREAIPTVCTRALSTTGSEVLTSAISGLISTGSRKTLLKSGWTIISLIEYLGFVEPDVGEAVMEYHEGSAFLCSKY